MSSTSGEKNPFNGNKTKTVIKILGKKKRKEKKRRRKKRRGRVGSLGAWGLKGRLNHPSN
jgi:hypothetical protein